MVIASARPVISGLAVLLLSVFGCGCEQSQQDVQSAAPQAQQAKLQAEGGFDASVYAGYMPVRIEILPLTEMTGTSTPSKLDAYVSLLDSALCQVKSPGTFRFELYEYVQRSAEPKGQRLAVWPDFDLSDPAANSKHWRDFLRAYEFNLDIEPQGSRVCVLQVTFVTPSGKRLSSEFTVRPSK